VLGIVLLVVWLARQGPPDGGLRSGPPSVSDPSSGGRPLNGWFALIAYRPEFIALSVRASASAERADDGPDERDEDKTDTEQCDEAATFESRIRLRGSQRAKT
jgi:hypothetical protein